MARFSYLEFYPSPSFPSSTYRRKFSGSLGASWNSTVWSLKFKDAKGVGSLRRGTWCCWESRPFGAAPCRSVRTLQQLFQVFAGPDFKKTHVPWFSSVKIHRSCVLIINGSVWHFPNLKQICTSNLPRNDMCQSHFKPDILHPITRQLGVLRNQKTAAPRKACCWLSVFFACIKTTTWVLGDPRQISAIHHCVCSFLPGIKVLVQQFQRFKWLVQAWEPPQLMDLMGCKLWKCVLDICWWNHISKQSKERAPPNTTQLQFSVASGFDSCPSQLLGLEFLGSNQQWLLPASTDWEVLAPSAAVHSTANEARLSIEYLWCQFTHVEFAVDQTGNRF